MNVAAAVSGGSQVGVGIPAGVLDPHGVLGTPGVFPGVDGLPFRGTPPMLRDNDPDHKQPQRGLEAHLDIFVLNNEDDKKKLVNIRQAAVNGYVQIGKEDLQYDAELKTWRVLVFWYDVFAYMPMFNARS